MTSRWSSRKAEIASNSGSSRTPRSPCRINSQSAKLICRAVALTPLSSSCSWAPWPALASMPSSSAVRPAAAAPAKHVRYPIRALHLGHKLFGHVDCNPPPLLPAVQDVTSMLLPTYKTQAGQFLSRTQDCGESSKKPSSAGQSAASERHRMKFRIGRPSYRPCVRTHTFMSSKTQYTNTRRNARVSALFCVSRQKLD